MVKGLVMVGNAFLIAFLDLMFLLFPGILFHSNRTIILKEKDIWPLHQTRSCYQRIKDALWPYGWILSYIVLE